MLRQATLKDIAQLATVKVGFDQAGILARFQWLDTVNATWYVWWCAQQPCGWALIQWDGKATAPDCPDLFDLYVHPAWRGQGIGTKLLTACEQVALARGHTRLGLAVNPDQNPRAYVLYQRLGYSPISPHKYIDGVYNGVEDWVIDLEKRLLCDKPDHRI